MNRSNNIKLFFVAFSISFIGALPIGTLNTSVANYGLNGDTMGAVKFGLAAILVEVVLVRIALAVLDKLAGLQKLFKFLSVAACVLILFLAFRTLEAAFHMRNFQDVLPFVSMEPFYSGLVLSILNPLHLPFWLGWTAVLKNRNVLSPTSAGYNVYILAIGVGTALSFIIYGFAGDFLMSTLKAQHNLINWILGFTLLFTGLVQVYKIIKKYLKGRALVIDTANNTTGILS